jgi:phage terminase large subunit-like protein
MTNDLRHKYCYECYADWHLCICEESVRGFAFATQPEEKIVIAGMTLTKRGEKVLTTFATLIMLLVAVTVGTIESLS